MITCFKIIIKKFSTDYTNLYSVYNDDASRKNIAVMSTVKFL